MAKLLTQRQTEILAMIQSFTAENGFPPTRRDIADHFGFLPNAAQCHITALRAKNLIVVRGGKARGVFLGCA